MKLALPNGKILELSRSKKFIEFAYKPYSCTRIILDQLNSGKFSVGIGDIAFDVGANIGLFSIFISSNFRKVYAVEPTEEHIEVMEDLISCLEISNISIIPKALSLVSEGVRFYTGNVNSTMNSLVPCHQHTSFIEVEGLTIDEIFRLEDNIDFLKMDIEGGELALFENSDFIKKISYIPSVRVEVHDFPELKIENIKKNIDSIRNKILSVNPNTKFKSLADDELLILNG